MKKVSGVVVALLIATSAMAFDLQNFYTPFGDEGFALFSSNVLGHLQAWAGVSSNYSKNPFQIKFTAPGEPGMTEQIIDYYFVNQFGAAIGFFNFLQLGVGASYNRPEGHRIPLADAQAYGVENDIDIPGLITSEHDTSFWAGYMGDVRAQIKGQIFKDRPRSIGIAIATELTYPTNPDNIDFYMTFGSFTAAGFLVVQKTFDMSILSLTLDGNGGFRYVAPAKYTDPETDETTTIDYADSNLPGVFEWRAGAILVPSGLKQLNVNLEGVGRHFDPDPSSDFIDMSNSIEALLGVGWKFPFGLKLSAAGGTSLMKDIGGPDYRALVQMSFTYPSEKKKKVEVSKEEAAPEKKEEAVTPKEEVAAPKEEAVTTKPAPTVEKAPEIEVYEAPEKEIIRFDSGIVLYENRLVVPKNILFVENKTNEILKESLPILQDLQKLMEGYPTLKIRLIGYADPDEKENSEALAAGRAEMVKKFLVSRGISPDRIETIGKGTQNPVTTLNEPENKKLNRRVEIVMLSL